MCEEIKSWLEKVGLGKYAEIFSKNEIDFRALPRLSEEDLIALGLPLGARRNLQAAIEHLSEEDTKTVPTTPTGPTTISGEAERRQLTVMFCDLVGSTELSQKLDPEDMRQINRAYQDACKESIERYDGYVSRYMGDGVLAYFGYPQAHEDDAERAVRAGLSLVETVSALKANFEKEGEIKLAVRVGIATGLVVVGDLIGEGASQESAVVGETPNLAARLQSLADENTVLIGPGTHELVRGRFEYADLGALNIKGIAAPVHIWQVIAPSALVSRFETLQTAKLTPLVGRGQEIELLLERWMQAREGEGQVTLLSGEAGIGKSRIVEVLQERIYSQRPVRLRYQCSPYHTNSALHPIIEQLEGAAEFGELDTAATKLEKLGSMLMGSTQNLEDAVPLIAALLSVPVDGRYAPLELTPERQKERTLETLIAQIEGLSQQRPVLLVFEDAHWADPTSLELLELIIGCIQKIRVFAIITCRPDFSSSWTRYNNVTFLTLNRLTRTQVNALAEEVTGGRALPGMVTELIIEKTDGVPLFVEELTKTILESDLLEEKSGRYTLSRPLSEVAIPATLHDSLMGRLDRLGAVKEVAQFASAIGREFSYDLLAAVSSMKFTQLNHALSRLVEAELLFRRGRSLQKDYAFKHALVRDAAHESLLKSKRKRLHARIAEVLEAQFPERTESEPELLAYHFTEGRLIDRAIHYWKRAGQTSSGRSANLEALGHLRKALELVGELPVAPERAHEELQVLTMTGSVMIAVHGYGANEVERIYERAREVALELGETAQLFPVLWGLHAFYMVRAKLNMSQDLAEQCLRIAQTDRDPGLLLMAYRARANTSLFLGRFVEALEDFDSSIRLYNPDQHSSYASIYVVDPKVNCLLLRSQTLWCLGYPDQALQGTQQALMLAEDISHKFTLAFALSWTAMVHHSRREVRLAKERAEATLAVSAEGEFAFSLAWGRVIRDWALTEGESGDEGIDQLREGLSGWMATGAGLWRPRFLTMLAEACKKAGRHQEALTALDEASLTMDRTDERWYEAEVQRVRGELLFEVGADDSEVEGCFEAAIEIARLQRAKSWELRASMSLARLWRDRDKRQAARDLLANVLKWFTEGLDTKDLKDAESLLEHLS